MDKKDLTKLSKILYELLFSRFPEWEAYAKPSTSEYDDLKKSLYIAIPSPINKDHFISITERGDCIEIAYSNGNLQMNAEQQITGEDIETTQDAIEFIDDIIKEKIVVGQEKTFWGLGSKLLSLRFINALESQNKKFINAYSWQGNFNKTIS